MHIGRIDADHSRADEQDYHEHTRCDWIMNAAAARVSGESGHQMICVIAGVLWSSPMLLSDFIVAPLKSSGTRSQRWRSNRLPHSSCIPVWMPGGLRSSCNIQYLLLFTVLQNELDTYWVWIKVNKPLIEVKTRRHVCVQSSWCFYKHLRYADLSPGRHQPTQTAGSPCPLSSAALSVWW